MSIFSFFQKKRLETIRSSIHGDITVAKSFRRKALFTGTTPQSGGEFIYMWDQVMTRINKLKFIPQSMILLGVAGGTAITSAQKLYPDITIKGVDIDPVIIDAGKRFFELKEDKKVTIIIADAVAWVNKQPKTKYYDLIIVDLFIGQTNPPQTRSKTFLASLKKLLAPRGILIINCDYQKENQKKYDTYKRVCTACFRSVEEIFSYPLNRILLLRN